MDEHLEAALIDCLDGLEQGQPIDQVLARYPELASELRPMLKTAVTLPQLNVQPSLAAQRHSRDAFLSQAAAQKETKTLRQPSPWFSLRRALMPFAALALVVMIFAAGLGPLSAGALPGDALYEVKLLVENARSAFAANPAADAALTEQFNQRRIQEIGALLAQNRTADVAFTGEIEAIQPGSWTISGLTTEITGGTQILGGDPLIGQMAKVDGRTENGSLIAATITLLPTGLPPTAEPTHTPPATSEPTETETPTATHTYTPTPMPTATNTPELTITSTNTPEPTATATIEPTATVTPIPPTAAPPPSNDNDGDDNDNTNDNENDNENDNDDDNENDDDNNNDNH
jgi:hypothetical protein